MKKCGRCRRIEKSNRRSSVRECRPITALLVHAKIRVIERPALAYSRRWLDFLSSRQRFQAFQVELSPTGTGTTPELLYAYNHAPCFFPFVLLPLTEAVNYKLNSAMRQSVPANQEKRNSSLNDVTPVDIHRIFTLPPRYFDVADVAEHGRQERREFLEGFSRLSPRVMGVKSVGGGLRLHQRCVKNRPSTTARKR